jgi:hypothetical protein
MAESKTTIDANHPITQIFQKTWAKANKFNVDVRFLGTSSIHSEYFWHDAIDDEDINKYVISVALPDVANENIEEWVGNGYRYAPGRESVHQLTITLRDEQGNGLYRTFMDILQRSRDRYFKEILWHIKVAVPGEKQQHILTNNTVIFDEDNAILVSVSGLTYGQETDQLTEFSVTFKL